VEGFGWKCKKQFKKKLAVRFSGSKNRFKIKLRSAGYRLVYEVLEKKLIVAVVAVGKRERQAVYKAASKRI